MVRRKINLSRKRQIGDFGSDRPSGGVDELRSELGRMIEGRERARKQADLDNHDGWKEVEKVLDAQIEELDATLDNFEKLSDEARYYALSKRQSLKRFRNTAKEAADLVDSFDEAISKVKARIQEIERA